MADVAPAVPAQPAPSPPTAAPDTPSAGSPTDTLANLSAPELQDWRQTGTLPDGASARRRPDTDAAAGDAAPDEAATPKPTAAPTPEQRAVSKRQAQINDYERRIAEQAAELARYKTPPAAPTRPTPDRAPIRLDITKPPLDEAAFYTARPDASTADYLRYVTHFDREVERVTSSIRRSETEAHDAAQTRASKFHAQITAIAPDPAVYLEHLDPELVALETRDAARAQGKPIGAANDLADEILDSDVAPQILEYLTAHPDDKAKLLASPTRRALVRAFSRIELQFTPSAARAGMAPKTVTDAPAPPVTLGQRSTQAGDAVESAIRSRDAGAYMREANARELAARGK